MCCRTLLCAVPSVIGEKLVPNTESAWGADEWEQELKKLKKEGWPGVVDDDTVRRGALSARTV